jgi:phenylalanyl-tRNA synthetase beta chain
MRIFEVSDVAFKDMSMERKSRNERHFAAAFYGKSGGFEIVHGLLDRIMAMLKTAFITGEEGLENSAVNDSQYYIKETDGMSPLNQNDMNKNADFIDATYFPGHAGSIHIRIGGKDQVIGSFGVLHPTVLEKYELKYPVSVVELNVEAFL